MFVIEQTIVKNNLVALHDSSVFWLFNAGFLIIYTGFLYHLTSRFMDFTPLFIQYVLYRF